MLLEIKNFRYGITKPHIWDYVFNLLFAIHLVVNYHPGINEHTEAVFPNSNPLFIQFISKLLTTQCINQIRAINTSLMMDNTLGNR